MSIPAWKVISWAPVNSTVEHWNKIVKKFCALGASVYADDGDGVLHGQVLWGVQAADQSVGMAWDWREAYPGVVAMADPMTILTNVTLIDSEENILADSKRIVHLNTGIYQLPWQAHIKDAKRKSAAALQAARAASPAANRTSASLAA